MSSHDDIAQFEAFNAEDYKIAIVTAQFNKSICDQMVDEAHKECARYGVLEKNIEIFKVAGSVEIPVILKKLADSGKYDCLIAIGVIIRGTTPHFDYVAKMVSDGITQVQMEHTLPVGFGILTVDNINQAKERIFTARTTAEAALQSANIIKNI